MHQISYPGSEIQRQEKLPASCSLYPYPRLGISLRLPSWFPLHISRLLPSLLWNFWWTNKDQLLNLLVCIVFMIFIIFLYYSVDTPTVSITWESNVPYAFLNMHWITAVCRETAVSELQDQRTERCLVKRLTKAIGLFWCTDRSTSARCLLSW